MIKHGIIGGIVAAIGMMMAEMIIAALMGMDFGTVLGVYFDRALAPRREAVPATASA